MIGFVTEKDNCVFGPVPEETVLGGDVLGSVLRTSI